MKKNVVFSLFLGVFNKNSYYFLTIFGHFGHFGKNAIL